MYISYENYDKKAENYDKNRIPVEVDLIVNKIKSWAQQNNKKIEDLVLGDFGCGTGNYVSVILEHFNFKKIIAVEKNQGMINVFKRKFPSGPESKVELKEQSLFEIDFENQKVDVAMINQVTHHLDTQKMGLDRISTEFPNLGKVLQNISDKMNPGGLLLINISTPLQNIKGYWFINHLLPPKIKIVRVSSFESSFIYY